MHAELYSDEVDEITVSGSIVRVGRTGILASREMAINTELRIGLVVEEPRHQAQPVGRIHPIALGEGALIGREMIDRNPVRRQARPNRRVEIDAGRARDHGLPMHDALGVDAYGSDSLFPTHTYNSTSYGVDVLFRPQLTA